MQVMYIKASVHVHDDSIIYDDAFLQVSVGLIVPGGAADVDGQLRAGDEIVQVDHDVVLGVSHRKVVQLMTQASLRGQVRLVTRRRLMLTNGKSRVLALFVEYIMHTVHVLV